MPNRHRIATLFICAAGLTLSLPVHPTLAAPAAVSFTVNSSLDQIDNNVGDGVCLTTSGTCTLRAAVMEADAASGAGATITLPAGLYSLIIPASGADGPQNGDLNLTTPDGGHPVISLVGAGAASTIIDANQIDRVLIIGLNRTAMISGLTLRDGYIAGSIGGGIANEGNLTLDHTTVTGNQSVVWGGGIWNRGLLTVTNSTIGPYNTAPVGGGIFLSQGIVTLDRSTVYSNTAQNGAGIYNYVSQGLYLINSTVSHNTAATNGGGIYNHGITNVYNSTIVFNSADTAAISSSAAGGVFSDNAGTFNLRNTLLAGNNVAVDRTPSDCAGTIHSYGFNLFGENPPCTLGSGDGAWDVVNSLFLIGPLQSNGGPTLTHALLAGSNAIDNGDPALGCVGPSDLLATDQRGLPRVVGASCDVGAFEFLPPTLYLPLARK